MSLKPCQPNYKVIKTNSNLLTDLFTGRYYSQGIVSWGEDCAHEELYGVYANVTMLKDWVITSIIDESDPF